MSRHDQRGDADKFVCWDCRFAGCLTCIDRLRAVYTTDSLCHCKKKGHGA